MVVAGDRVLLAAEHDAIGIEQVGPPIRAGAGKEMIAEFTIKRLAEIWQPEHRRVSDHQRQIVEHDLLSRIDAGFSRADPEVRILDIVGGDAGILTDQHLAPTLPFHRELSGFEQDRIDRSAQPAGIEKLPLIVIDRPLAALHHVSLIDGHVPLQRGGFRLKIHKRPICENLQAIVTLDFDRPSEVNSGFDVALDGATAVAEIELRGHRLLREFRGAHGDFRCRHGRDGIDDRRLIRIRQHVLRAQKTGRNE